MTGIQRLDILVKDQIDTALCQVVNHLKNLKDIDDNIFLNTQKDLKGMCDYIKSKIEPLAVNNMAFASDDVVYGLAVDYWQKSNEELEPKKKKEPPAPAVKNVVIKKEEKPETAQLTLF